MTYKSALILSIIIIQCIYLFGCTTDRTKSESVLKLTKWDRGIKVESRIDKNGSAYLWFYEWHLFDAVKKGEHTPGSSKWIWNIDSSGTVAQLDSEWLRLKLEATEDGVDMVLDITNNTDHDWPDIAAIIPCFNPGTDASKVTDAIANPLFFDQSHENTYFLGKNGLELIKGDQYPREIHFNHDLRASIMTWDKERDDEKFVFYHKWPTSGRDAYTGFMVRESEKKDWVMGIAWQDYISVQGHNPWNCMHLSIRVGPLKQAEKKTIRGKIYLFKGLKEECLSRYREDFPRNNRS